jgi:hypothetical protein
LHLNRASASAAGMAAGEVLFLFNHDAPHQVAHIAGIARAMRATRPDIRVTCATGTEAIRARVASLLGDAAIGVSWLDIALPRWLEMALALPNRIAPAQRLARLDHHARRLLQADVLVSAERTCLRLRRHVAGHSPLFVHVPHGAGDRAVSFHKGKSGFDRILVSGAKTAREMVARSGIETDKLRVVGYPKFDTVDVDNRLNLFDNDRPTFLYNPHFDPFLSSWYGEGPKLLDWFASEEGQKYNLIFAPHIMLFRKKLHVSLEYRTARVRPDIQDHWKNSPNILIDIDSDRLVDMSYTLSADAYIGDVSSQIYEFLIRPRPVYFIDRFSQDRRSKEGRYPAWEAGEVVHSADDLTQVLRACVKYDGGYAARQQALFADTISYEPGHPASQRAAEAIAELLPA